MKPKIKDRKYVWVVRYSNYEPFEVKEVCSSEKVAKEITEKLGGMWVYSRIRVIRSMSEYRLVNGEFFAIRKP